MIARPNPAYRSGLAGRAPGQQHLAREAGEEPPDIPYFSAKIEFPQKHP
jgi:hypothetical protein